MTEVSFKKNFYIYGKFYDSNRVKVPTDKQSWTGLIIYVNPKRENNRIISSLEGYFVSDDNFLSSKFPQENPICHRDQMEEFEKMYKGKFIPF